MISKNFNAYTRYTILKHGFKNGNISETCELFKISRTTFYNWKNAYEKYGVNGLRNQEPRKPNMPNKIGKEIEEKILDYVRRYPKDGPRRIYYELKSEGFSVGETGIYNVLKRNKLTKKEQRVKYSRNKKYDNKNLNDLKNKNLYSFKTEKTYPGHLSIQRINFVGTFDNIGEIYQYLIYDMDSKWVEIKLYNRKQDIDVWDFFELKLVYLMETFNINIENLITEKERNFLPYFVKGEKYNEIINTYNINHLFYTLESTDVFEEILEFNKYLVKNFYNNISLGENINSFIEIHNELKTFIRKYNFTNKILIGENKGKTPAQVIFKKAKENGTDLDTLPLWIVALIESSKRGVENGQKQI